MISDTITVRRDPLGHRPATKMMGSHPVIAVSASGVAVLERGHCDGNVFGLPTRRLLRSTRNDAVKEPHSLMAVPTLESVGWVERSETHCNGLWMVGLQR